MKLVEIAIQINKKEEIDDKIYCFDENGHKIVNGFFETENNRKYYLGDDGVAYVEKWLKDYNGYDYYFDVWGYMVRNKKQYSIKNEETNEYEYYEFDSEGRCIKK